MGWKRFEVVRIASEPTSLRYSKGTDDSDAAAENRIVTLDGASILSTIDQMGEHYNFQFLLHLPVTMLPK